ncbi:MAG: TIGR03086 family metal-binding protein, partial [Allobranchiibius sp.]
IIAGWMPTPGNGVDPGAPVVTGSAGDALDGYRQSARTLTGAFHFPGVLNQLVTVPFGTVPGNVALHLRIIDLLVHGWDLAQATGQAVRCPDALAEQEFQFTTAMLAGLPPDQRPFAPPQPVADDAPAIDRLAACLGRRVTT